MPSNTIVTQRFSSLMRVYRTFPPLAPWSASGCDLIATAAQPAPNAMNTEGSSDGLPSAGWVRSGFSSWLSSPESSIASNAP